MTHRHATYGAVVFVFWPGAQMTHDDNYADLAADHAGGGMEEEYYDEGDGYDDFM